MKPGFIPFWSDDVEGAAEAARDFCKTRGLNAENARIVKRNGKIEVEIKRKCALKVTS